MPVYVKIKQSSLLISDKFDEAGIFLQDLFQLDNINFKTGFITEHYNHLGMKIDGLFLHVFSHIRVKAKVAQCQIYQVIVKNLFTSL